MEKLSLKEATELLNRFIETELPTKNWFRQVEHSIRAIIFYGSTAKDTHREDSDLDLLIILPLAEEEAYTAGEYFYNFEGREINIVLRSIERLEKIADSINDPFQISVFEKSQILWQRDTWVSKLIKKILTEGPKGI